MKTRKVLRRVHVGLAAMAAAFVVCTVSAAEIFKSVDSQGRPIYSDRPPAGGSERIYIPTPSKSSEDNRERATAELVELRRRAAERQTERELRAQEKAQKEKSLQAQLQRCEQARNRFLTFSEANRLYRRDAQGDRVYFTGPEIDAEREKARREIQANCGA